MCIRDGPVQRVVGGFHLSPVPGDDAVAQGEADAVPVALRAERPVEDPVGLPVGQSLAGVGDLHLGEAVPSARTHRHGAPVGRAAGHLLDGVERQIHHDLADQDLLAVHG